MSERPRRAWLGPACAALALVVCWPERLAAQRPRAVRVILGGDVFLGGGVAWRARRDGWPGALGRIAPLLGGADLAVVNLEGPLAPCLPGGTVAYPRRCGEAEGAAALASAGVDAVTVANNHALDAGEGGLLATVAALRAQGIAALGVRAARSGRPVPERLGSLAVVAANATPPANPPGSAVPVATPEGVAGAVREARRRWPGAPVLTLLHAGREGWPWPSPRDGAYARAAVGAGAAAVVMHGAHAVRRLVWEDGAPVHLGLGNLLFDQRPAQARAGELLVLALRAGSAARVEAVHCTRCDDGATAPVPCP